MESEMFNIILTRNQQPVEDEPVQDNPHLVTPGTVITTHSDFMRGHGTYVEEEEIITISDSSTTPTTSTTPGASPHTTCAAVDDEIEIIATSIAPTTSGASTHTTCAAVDDEIEIIGEFQRGHGTSKKEDTVEYTVEFTYKMCAAVVGTVQKIDKLVYVKPHRSRYNGEVGDVVVGRIIEVQHRRWIVDIKARLNSVLLLSSVNLPGGELRRKTVEDERMMRNYLDVGDLISAEIQSVFADGALSLHTRSLKYGKLGQGILVNVPHVLVRRKKTHFHNIISGVQIILSNNGYIWIEPLSTENVRTGGYAKNLQNIPKADRESIGRVRNCILALVKHNKMLCDTTILYAFEAASGYEGKDILKPDIMKKVADAVKQRIEAEGI